MQTPTTLREFATRCHTLTPLTGTPGMDRPLAGQMSCLLGLVLEKELALVYAGCAGLPHSGRTALAESLSVRSTGSTSPALLWTILSTLLAPHPHQHLVWSPSLNLVIPATLCEYSDLVCTPVINNDVETLLCVCWHINLCEESLHWVADHCKLQVLVVHHSYALPILSPGYGHHFLCMESCIFDEV